MVYTYYLMKCQLLQIPVSNDYQYLYSPERETILLNAGTIHVLCFSLSPAFYWSYRKSNSENARSCKMELKRKKNKAKFHPVIQPTHSS